MIKFCENCKSEKESWEDHPWYHPVETFARSERCWSCNRWTLIRKDVENNILNPNNPSFWLLSPITIPLYYTFNSLLIDIDIKEKHLEDYIKKISSISGEIIDINPFETFWNKNIATIISLNNSSYWVFLGLVDRSPNASGKIKKHLAKAINKKMGKIGNRFQEYCLAEKNCEHFTFGASCGFWFSPQANKQPKITKSLCPKKLENYLAIFGGGAILDLEPHNCEANEGKSNICLEKEINETSNKFNGLTSENCYYEEEKIDNYKCQIETTSLKTGDCIIA